MKPAPLTRGGWAAVAAMLLLGAALHFAGLRDRSFNTDEVYLPLAGREGRFLTALWNDVHSPLHQVLLGAIGRWDLPEALARAVSVWCWLGVGLAGLQLGRRLSGEATGLAAMALLLTSPQGFMLSQAARPYALGTFAASWAIVEFAGLLDDANRRRANRLAAALAVACYSFGYCFYLLAALFPVAWMLRRRAHPAGAPAVRAAAIALAAFAPWMAISALRVAHGLSGWFVLPMSLAAIIRRVGQMLSRAGGIDGVEPLVFAVAPAVAGAVGTLLVYSLAAAGWWKLRAAEPAEARGRLAALTWWLAGALALAILGHRFLGTLLAIHYFAIFGAGAAVLLAAPFALTKRRFLAGALFAGVIAANFAMLPDAARSSDEPLRPAARWIDERTGPGDLVLGVAWFAIDGYRWYGEGRDARGFPVELRADVSRFRLQPAVADRDDGERLRAALAGRRRVALLLSHTAWNGVDRGVELVCRTLAEAGFALEAEAGWPLFNDNPSVRAQVWRHP